MKEYFSLFLFILFAILVNLSYSAHIDASISFEDKNPFIKMTIGNQTEKLLVSFSSSSIITFPKDKDSTEEPNSKSLENKLDKLTLNKKNKTLTLNEKVKFDLKFQESPSRIKEIGKLDGILGLGRKEKNKEGFLNQLKEKKNISKIIYIDSYYDNGKLKKESKIKIGEFPKEIDKNKMHDIPLNSNKDAYEFTISDSYIDYHNKTNITQAYKAKIEEGRIEPISIPKSLFSILEKYFTNHNCTIKKDTIDCSNKTDIMNNAYIKFKIKKFDFQFAIWKDGKFNLKVIDGESLILTSEFTGYYDRVYDLENNTIFFSDFRGYSGQKKETSILTIIIISGAGLVLIAIIVIFIVVCVQRAKGKKLTNKVNTISFTADKKEEDDDEESLLY
jgi:hypothetical protein